MTTPIVAQRRDGKTVDYEDVDDLIGIASELQSLDSDRLSVEDLRSVASDLDIPDRFVGPAIDELRRRRAATLATEASNKRRRTLAVGLSAAVLALLVLWALLGQASLGGDLAELARRRAQVVNVLERQAATTRQWQAVPHSDQKAAELSGAENRVRIERQRYDEAAAAYNARAASFPSSLWAGLFGHPDSVPLSNELDSF